MGLFYTTDYFISDLERSTENKIIMFKGRRRGWSARPDSMLLLFCGSTNMDSVSQKENSRAPSSKTLTESCTAGWDPT
jgi:hypothetical protein